MNHFLLCITAVLHVASVFSDQHTDIRNIQVFPAENQTIAGVFLVTHLNFLNQPQYAFNASEARTLCLSLGVDIASKAQVQKALSRGLETCRFGWIDEHFAVIPRIQALTNCGQNQTGLVPWRASVKKKFDVFCFNESDAVTQLKDTTTDTPSSSSYSSGNTQSTSSTPCSSSSSLLRLPFSSAPNTIDSEAEPARFVGTAKNSAGGKAVLITCICAFLLTAVIIFTYLKLRRRRSQSCEMQQQQQQQESIETEEWTCMRNMKETEKAAEEDERIEVDDDAH